MLLFKIKPPSFSTEINNDLFETKILSKDEQNICEIIYGKKIFINQILDSGILQIQFEFVHNKKKEIIIQNNTIVDLRSSDIIEDLNEIFTYPKSHIMSEYLYDIFIYSLYECEPLPTISGIIKLNLIKSNENLGLNQKSLKTKIKNQTKIKNRNIIRFNYEPNKFYTPIDHLILPYVDEDENLIIGNEINLIFEKDYILLQIFCKYAKSQYSNEKILIFEKHKNLSEIIENKNLYHLLLRITEFPNLDLKYLENKPELFWLFIILFLKDIECCPKIMNNPSLYNLYLDLFKDLKGQSLMSEAEEFFKNYQV